MRVASPALIVMIGLTVAAGLARAAEGDPVASLRGTGERHDDAGSPATIITAEDIRTHGFTTLGEALEWVRGMYVTSDRLYSYLGIRGIQRPGDFNNKVLLAVDGHVMNGNVYGDAYFDAALGIDLDLVDRIEVTLGPNSARYGNYAALAVVDVVLRRATDGEAAVLSGRTGSAERHQALLALASARPGRPAVAASVSWLDARGLDLYYPEFDSPATNNGLAIDADGEGSRAFIGSADWRGMRLVAKFNERVKRIPTASFGTVFGDNRYRAYDGHDFVELSGERKTSPRLALHGRTYWDRSHYHANYVYDSGFGPAINYDAGSGDVVGAEARAEWSPARAHAVTLGVEGNQSTAHLWNEDVEPYALYLDAHEDRALVGAYVRDRVRLADDLTLTAGVRLDHWNRFDPEWSPSVGLMWNAAQAGELSLEAARGYRAPTVYEARYEAPAVVRSEGLGPEHVATLQGSVAREVGVARFQITAYATRLSDVIDLVQIDTTGTVQYQNVDRVDSRGLEAEARFEPAPGTQVRLGLARQSSVLAGEDERVTNSPAWDGFVQYRRDPATSRTTVGAGIRYLSPRLMRTGRETAPAVVADARVGRWLGGRALVGVEVRNLFDSRYADPASGEFVQEQILRDPRAIFVTLALRSRDVR